MGEILSVFEHQALHQTPPTLSLWQCALEKKKTETETQIHYVVKH